MKTQEYIQSLFRDYEESEGLKDFMEELTSNLDARIASLVRKGIDEQEAFDKACGELGDISALANELSLKKRREVFEEVYMDLRKYMSGKRVAAYVVFGVTTVFGIIIALISYFAIRQPFYNVLLFGGGRNHDESLVAFIAALMPFLTTAVVGFTFLGLTQETKTHFPISKKRAAWYTVAAGLICIGFLVMFITYFSVWFEETHFAIMVTIATLIPFVLPGGGILTYLLLTEKNRLKPWVASLQENSFKQEMKMWNDPVMAGRLGMFSGAIWIFAAALFMLFGFLVGFRFSWLAFVFATAAQLLVQGFMIKKGSREWGVGSGELGVGSKN